MVFSLAWVIRSGGASTQYHRTVTVAFMHAGVYATTFLVVAGWTGLTWRLVGPERAGRFIGAAFGLLFLIAWAVVVAPGWRALDALGRVGHIVLGASILGLVFDCWRPPRVIALPLLVIFIAGVSWAEANGRLLTLPDTAGALRFIALALVGAVLAWRVENMTRAATPFGTPGPSVLMMLMMAALALATVAWTDGHEPFAATCLVLAVAIAGFLPWAWVTNGSVPWAVLCPAAAGLFASAWGIVDTSSAALPGVCLAALTLFADGTARRIPMPQARVAVILYPLLVGVMALLPLALAMAVTAALRR